MNESYVRQTMWSIVVASFAIRFIYLHSAIMFVLSLKPGGGIEFTSFILFGLAAAFLLEQYLIGITKWHSAKFQAMVVFIQENMKGRDR